MFAMLPKNVFDHAELRQKTRIFRDRFAAGEALSAMLPADCRPGGLLLAIPAGGVPVAAVIRDKLALEMDVAVVSKITLPWNSEAGYGAVAFDGSVRLNASMLSHIGLNRRQVEEGKQKTLQKVNRRLKLLRGENPLPGLRDRAVILVDDGLASGVTMQVAIEAVKKAGADTVIVAVPTAHLESIFKIAGMVDTLYCPNIRSGMRFAVADAYECWSDVDETQLLEILK